jgi:hypothetical protein
MASELLPQDRVYSSVAGMPAIATRDAEANHSPFAYSMPVAIGTVIGALAASLADDGAGNHIGRRCRKNNLRPTGPEPIDTG